MELVEGNILEFFKLFFIPQNYLFSLVGAIFGFTLVFLIKTHTIKKERPRYLDVIIYAFLASSLLGYFGSLLWGQIYGIPYSWPLSITYTHSDSIIKDRAALFPLAFLYILLNSALLIGLMKFAHKNVLPEGFIGYVGMAGFSLIVFLGEFLSGARKDIFYDYFGLGLNQIGALIGLIFAILWLLRLIQKKI
jgi:membrane-associated HD superfamily phosphohydrolase